MDAVLYLPVLLGNFAIRAPVILVCLGGCIGILTRWRRLGRAALPASFGFGLVLFVQISGVLLSLVPLLWRDRPTASIASVYTITGVVQSLLGAAGFGLILVAIFIDRAPGGAALKEHDSPQQLRQPRA